MPTLTRQAAERAVARIRDELERIIEEGLDSLDRWYAKDRFVAIATVAGAAAEGDEGACCIGSDTTPDFWDGKA